MESESVKSFGGLLMSEVRFERPVCLVCKQERGLIAVPINQPLEDEDTICSERCWMIWRGMWNPEGEE